VVFTVEKRYDYSCINPEKNNVIFLGVTLSKNGNYYLGWIELEISGNNTVHVIRTAIQK